MALFSRTPPLPPELEPAWRAFLDCAAVVEGGVRTLLGTLPIGRVEPAPVALGVTAMRNALDDAEQWMDRWRIEGLEADHDDCRAALVESRAALGEVEEVAASTDELEELQEAVGEVVGPLDAFADAERQWRRTWKVPRT